MTTTHDDLPLHTSKPSRQTTANRLFAVVHSCAILTLLYHHSLSLLNSTTATSFFITLTFLVSDSILAFMFTTTQSFRMRPIYRDEFPENMKRVVQELDVPALDVFICTAEPYKEPPMNVVNTALSVMAYDYPTEKLSVYVSDDGGSALTLFSFMEAAKFASHWLPFCRKNKIVECNPEAYFATDHSRFYEAEKIKDVYQGVKVRVNNVIEIGTVGPEHVTGEREIQAFSKWTDKFTKRDHPTVIQVVLDSSKDKDVSDHLMPNLIYVSREKRRTSLHHYKAGALNALLRVSATMTNAPIILTLDCDTYSNDSQTPHRALCYLSSDPKVGFVQFPQRFHGINKNDIYACEHKRLYKINPVGMDGLLGPNYLGTGSFFSRRAFFGEPSHLLPPEIPQLCPTNVVSNPIQSPEVTELAHRVAACSYEISTNWGSKIGVRYGSLVEDFFTGYRLHCEGWKSIFCHPTRAAFYGDAPMNLIDVLNQNKRWAVGDLEVAFSKYSPITYGTCVMGPLMGLSYAHYAFWPIWSIPLTTYAFLPQLALFNGLTTFPKVSEPWFLLYVFLFLGAYIQDLLDFVLAGGTVQTWWNDQRMWLIRGLSSFLFGTIEFFLKSLGIASHGFNVTSKVLDDDHSKRYEQGTIEFGVPSAMFVPLTMAAIVNLAAFAWGNVEVFRGKCSIEGVFVQMFIAGFGTMNSKPIYEAIISRKDKGRIPKKTAVVSTSLAFALFAAAHVTLRN